MPVAPAHFRKLLSLGLVLTSSCQGSETQAVSPADHAAHARASAPPEASVCEEVEAPQTAPGQRLAHLVAAINAEDASVVDNFVSNELSDGFLAAVPVERHVQVIRGLRGDGPKVQLCRIESQDNEEVVALLGGPDGKGGIEYGRFTVTVEGDDEKVSSLSIEPASKEDLTRKIEPLDQAERRQIVEDVAGGLSDYVFADTAEKMQARLREAREAGEYAGITNHRKLARRLTEDLRAVSEDKHLRVVHSASVLPPVKPERSMTPEEIEQFKKHAASDNFGMPVAEIRDGNVGYLQVLGFLPPEVAAEAVAETMSKLADADVLIIDLRKNGGGNPGGVALMTSYLFGKKRVHLNDIYYRSEDRTESFYTSPDAPGRHFGGRKPIYVLTSQRTFSAGEEFAYNLQARKRATIIGEVTGGGAHPTGFVRVSDHWAIALPNARAINPITKTNWEGTGVTPDVEVPADQALDKALALLAKAKKAN